MRAKNSFFCFKRSDFQENCLSFRMNGISFPRNLLSALVVFALAVGCLDFVPGAEAQERVQRSKSILEFFGFTKPKREKIIVKRKKTVRKAVVLKDQRRQKKFRAKSAPAARFRSGIAAASPAAPAYSADAPAAPIVKLDNAKVVMVIGDFMAEAVAEGLTEAFEASPEVKIAGKWNGSSGFVRDDHYDWPASVPGLIAEIKPAIVIVMIGANDRQQMIVGENRESVGTPLWTAEYQKRAQALAQALKTGGAPIVWVGQPAFRSGQMSASMIAFNDIYRKSAEAAGGVYVDLWDGFVDEAGAFMPSGPDMNGLPARLRGGDGITFSKAGRRKAAFYVEKPLRQLLGGAGEAMAAALPRPSLSGFIGPMMPAPVEITRTSPIGINDPVLDGGSELLGASPRTAKPGAKSLRDSLIIDGIGPPPKPGRVDDFTLKDARPDTIGAAEELAPDQTGATK
jgi:uncharacterized protein